MLQPKTIGEPYTGNLYVRFDEGGGLFPRLYSNVDLFIATSSGTGILQSVFYPIV